jgi:hypothetical protein
MSTFPLSLMRKSITVYRHSAGSLDANDRWVEGSETPITHKHTSVQPTTGRDLLVLPEGERNDSIVRIFDAEPLYVTNKSTGVEADVIEWLGERYKVINVQVWNTGVFDYYEALADKERQ